MEKFVGGPKEALGNSAAIQPPLSLPYRVLALMNTQSKVSNFQSYKFGNLI